MRLEDFVETKTTQITSDKNYDVMINDYKYDETNDR